jgi:hypothetical protein
METGIAVVVLVMLVPQPSHAQREGENYMAPLGSCGRSRTYIFHAPTARAININPATGRTYSRGADYLPAKRRQPSK